MFGYCDNNNKINYSEINQKVIKEALLNNWKSTIVFINDISDLNSLLLNKSLKKYTIHTINFNTGIISNNNSYKLYKLIKNNELYTRPPFQKDIKLIDEQSYYKSKTECPICIENEKIMVIKCGHTFCYNCVINLENCSLCRKPINCLDIKRIY